MTTTHKLSKLALFAISATLFAPIVHASASETIKVCVSKSSGVMRQLVKGKCKSTEKKLTLSKVGPAGAVGPVGPQGVTGATGPVGPQGPAGPAGGEGTAGKSGVDGKSGNTILSGTTDPTTAIGVPGDFYINTTTSRIFGPKTTTWPTGTSLIGPRGEAGLGGSGATGATGATGPQGPAGLTGASTSVLWLNARDLEASRYNLSGDTSTVTSLTLTDNFFHVEVLDLMADKERVIFTPIPKGWSDATSLTIRAYWTTTEVQSGKFVEFEIVAGSRGNSDDLSSEQWGRSAAGTNVAALGGKILQTTNFTWYPSAENSYSVLAENDLFTLSVYRIPEGGFGSAGAFTGKVYLIGVSIQANFP